MVRPTRPARWLRFSPATTCALVTTRPGAAIQPLPSCVSLSHTSPLTFTVDARTRRLTAGVIDVAGWRTRIRRRLQRAECRGNGSVGDRAAPRRELRRLLRRPALDRGDHRRAPRHAERASPSSVANDGMTIQSRTSTPSAPTAAPARPGPTSAAAGAWVVMRCTSEPRTRPIVWPNVATTRRGTTPPPWPGSPARVPPNAVTMRGHEVGTPITSPMTMPTHASRRADEPESPAADRRRRMRAR